MVGLKARESQAIWGEWASEVTRGGDFELRNEAERPGGMSFDQ